MNMEKDWGEARRAFDEVVRRRGEKPGWVEVKIGEKLIAAAKAIRDRLANPPAK